MLARATTPRSGAGEGAAGWQLAPEHWQGTGAGVAGCGKPARFIATEGVWLTCISAGFQPFGKPPHCAAKTPE